MHGWRERLARWLTPVARRYPFSPNTVTIAALVLNLVAAALLYYRRFFVAVPFIATGGICDALDGLVARAQQRETRFGDFLDHVADRISDSALTAGWMLGSGVREELTLAAVIVVLLNGYVGTQIEATYRQRNYESIGRGEFVLALIAFPIITSIVNIADWLAIALIAFALLGIGQRIVLASRLERSQ